MADIERHDRPVDGAEDGADAPRVFISYTREMTEFPAGRSFADAAREAVIDVDGRPLDMHRFPAAEIPPAELCEAEVRRCDAWIGIIGFKYGSPVRDRPEVSYTELEYLAARNAGMPRFAFLLSLDAVVPAAAVMDVAHGARQAEFRKGLREITTKTFATPDELQRHVADTLRKRLPGASQPQPSDPRPAEMAPPVAEFTVGRPAITEDVVRLITASTIGEAGRARSVALTTKLEGAGGFGKTTMARVVANDPRVVERFPGGVLWAAFGQRADVLNIVSSFHDEVTKTGIRFTDIDRAAAKLAEALRNKPCLIVLDDVWEPEAVRPFERINAPSVVLITTRVGDVAPDAARIEVDEMASGEAVQVLVARLRGHTVEPGVFRRLAERLGEWPLLLGIAAAAIARRVDDGQPPDAAAGDLIELFDLKGPAKFVRQSTTERERAVALTVEYGLDSLSSLSLGREQYAELALFPEDVPVDVPAVAALWGLDDLETDALLDGLHSLSLIELDRSSGSSTFTLHDVVRAYLEAEIPDRGAIHCRLIDAIGDPLELSDGYLLRHFSHHLVQAGRQGELVTLVDVPWMMHKHRETGSHGSFADDAALAWNHLERVDPPDLAHELRIAMLLGGVADQASRIPAQVFEAWARSGRIDQALTWASLITDSQGRATMMGVIARWATPKERARVMRSIFRGSRGKHERVEPTLVQLARSYISGGDVSAALALLDEVDGELRGRLTGHVIDLAAELLGPTAALTLANGLSAAIDTHAEAASAFIRCTIGALRHHPVAGGTADDRVARAVHALEAIDDDMVRLDLCAELDGVAPPGALDASLEDAYTSAANGPSPEAAVLALVRDLSVPAVPVRSLVGELRLRDLVSGVVTLATSGRVRVSADLIRAVLGCAPTNGHAAASLLASAEPDVQRAGAAILAEWATDAESLTVERARHATAAVQALDALPAIAKELLDRLVSAAAHHERPVAVLEAIARQLEYRSPWDSTDRIASVGTLVQAGYGDAAGVLVGALAEQMMVRARVSDPEVAVERVRAGGVLRTAVPDLARELIREGLAELVRPDRLAEAVAQILRTDLSRVTDPDADALWAALDHRTTPEARAVVRAWAASRWAIDRLPAPLDGPVETDRATLLDVIESACTVAAAEPDESTIFALMDRATALPTDECHAALGVISASRRIWATGAGYRDPGTEKVSRHLAARGHLATVVGWVGSGRPYELPAAVYGAVTAGDAALRSVAVDAFVALTTASQAPRYDLIRAAVAALVIADDDEGLARFLSGAGLGLSDLRSLAPWVQRARFPVAFAAMERQGGAGRLGKEETLLSRLATALERGSIDRAASLADELVRRDDRLARGVEWALAFAAIARVVDEAAPVLASRASQLIAAAPVTDAEDALVFSILTIDVDVVGGLAVEDSLESRASLTAASFAESEDALVVALAPRLLDILACSRAAPAPELAAKIAAATEALHSEADLDDDGSVLLRVLSSVVRWRLHRAMASDPPLADADAVETASKELPPLRGDDSEVVALWFIVVAELAVAEAMAGRADSARERARQIAASSEAWIRLTEDDDDLILFYLAVEPALRCLAVLGDEAVPAVLGLIRTLRDVAISRCPIAVAEASATLVAVGEGEAVRAVARTMVEIERQGYGDT